MMILFFAACVLIAGCQNVAPRDAGAGARTDHARNRTVVSKAIVTNAILPPDSVAAIDVGAQSDHRPPADAYAQSTSDTGTYGLPRVVVNELEYDFDLMDPHTDAEHSFVFENHGDQPLKLTDGGTTCKCAFASLPKEPIPPSESAEIKISWSTPAEGEFYQAATIRTNDPRKPSVRLAIKGLVRTQFGIYPSKLTYAQLFPDRPDNRSVLVYSQVWDHFDVEDIRSDWKGLDWNLRPAPLEVFHEFDVKSAYYLDLKLPADLEPGFFNHSLRLNAYGPTPRATKSIDAKLVGKVLRRLCVYGKHLDSTGTIDAGVIENGDGRKLRFLMKVRDVERQINVVGVETEPKFLAAHVTPRDEGQPGAGLYDLEVEIPPEAPNCMHMGINAGKLSLVIDHPRIKRLDLRVKFCVVDG
jgi:hypothetical protein